MKVTKAIIKKKEKRAKKRLLKQQLEEWKLKIVERDNNRCQMCGKELIKSKSRNVHHILPNTKLYFDLRSDVNNGILLCPQCHRFSPNSPHQNSIYFAEFLKKNRSEQYYYLCSKITPSL